MRQVGGSLQMDLELITRRSPSPAVKRQIIGLALANGRLAFRRIKDLDLGKDSSLTLNEPLELHHLAGTHTDSKVVPPCIAHIGSRFQ